MKKIALAALAVLLLCACASPALAEWQDRYLSQDSAVFDRAFAQEALKLSTLIYYRDQQAAYMRKAGFNTVGYWNFHRPAGDTRHICAYYVYQKALPDGRTAVLILIRGTGDDEWALNMDVMPSGNYDLPYAENFTLAAQDILDTQAAYLDSLADPVFLVSGHSRGAACANILGKMLTDRYGAQRVYAYTFATPRTVRGEYPAYANIFNVINPTDYITMLPLPQWGFARYGVDVILPVVGASEQQLSAVQADFAQELGNWGTFQVFKEGDRIPTAFVAAIAEFSPTVRDAYQTRHSLLGPGLAQPDEDGMTGSEFLMRLSTAILGQQTARLILDISALKAKETDFDPILNVLTSAAFSGEINALTMAHMPGMYAAWLSVME